MLNSFFQAICRVGIFMICAQALLHFRAQETYEKYLKMLVSIMILIQLFIPVGAFFMGEKKDETAEALRQFKQDMEAGIQAAEENAAAADAILEQMTLEEVQSRMEEQEGVKGEEQEDGSPNLNSGRADIEVEPIESVSIGTVSPEAQEGR
nr:hypothetical protein [uncultured Acetatifactor sp.]